MLNIVLLFSLNLYSQKDSIPYLLMDQKWTFTSTIGYNTAPFILRDNFNLTDNTLQYKANMNPAIGFGLSHKWISLGFSFKMPGYLRDIEKFGESEYYDFDFRFNKWGWHFSGDLHYYKSFRLTNKSIEQEENQINELIYNELNTFSTSLNGYYFLDTTYNTKAAFGMSGRYNAPTYSLYVKNTLNMHRIKNETNMLLPSSLTSANQSIWNAHNIGALDAGIVPGLAYVNNINGWQFGGMVGVGAVIQAKYYSFENNTRVFFGLAPRLDLNLYAGYNTNKWFLMLHSNLDNKSIRFNNFTYRQIYYYVRLTAGIRFDSLNFLKNSINYSTRSF